MAKFNSSRCNVLYNNTSFHDWEHIKYIPVVPEITIVPYDEVDSIPSTLPHNEIKECRNCRLCCVFDHTGTIVKILHGAY